MPVYSDLPAIPFPCTAFHQMMFDEFKKFETSIALINSATSEQFSYKDILSKSRFVASALLTLGLEKGEVVLICVPNCPDFVWLFLGISLAGGIVSGLHPKFSKDEMRQQVHDSRSRIAFVAPASVKTVVSVLEEQAEAFRVVCVGTRADSQGYPIMEDLQFSGPCCSRDFPLIDAENDMVFLPYSSGTIGFRKGVMFTHQQYCGLMLVFNNPTVYEQPRRGERTIGVLSFYYQFGSEVLFSALFNGATVLTVPEFSSDDYFRLLQTHKVRTQYLMPPLLQLMTKEEYIRRFDLTALENIIVSAAPVDKEISDRLLKMHPTIKNLIQVYGMTEAGAICRSETTANKRSVHGSCGSVCANLAIKVVDMITGEELGANQQGLLLLKGPQLMSGYWFNEVETAHSFRKDGWLDTGDIGYFDEKKNFFIVDRWKEMMKVYGFQVVPAELEDILLSHPAVSEAAVVPIDDEYSGQKPIAYVVLKAKPMKTFVTAPATESLATAKNIQDFANSKLVKYKQIYAVIIAQTLPRSPGGKLLRRLLREAASVYDD